jgi:DNA-binding NarL/FixJ family response regulator
MIRIGIVDDKLINHTALISKLSSKSDIEIVLQATNGRDFLDKMKNQNLLPDIVFMDIDMPVMDGIDAVKQGSVLYPSVHFLMLTVFDDDEKIFDAIKAGAVGYLLKDEHPERLMDAIYEVLQFGGAPMSPSIARKSLNLLSRASFVTKKTENTELSSREMEILKGLIDGFDYKTLADKLFLSPNTVRTHIANIYKKLHVNNRTQAVKVAMKKGWFNF